MDGNTKGVHYSAGIIGGLVAGIVLGLLNTAIGAMPVLAVMMGSDSMVVAWLVHLALTVLIGVFFAWWFGNRIDTYGEGVGYGILHGIIWWFAAWVVLIPLMLGFQVSFTRFLSAANIMMLIGYILYGVILGATYVLIDRPHVRFHHRHVPGVR